MTKQQMRIGHWPRGLTMWCGGALLLAVALAGGCAPRDAARSAADSLAAGGAPATADLQTAALAPEPGDVRLAPDVLVRRMAPGLWMHVTVGVLRDGAYYPANGMLLETDSGAVLFDTGWNDAQTTVLFDWAARELKHPVRRVIGTHFHQDRIGGITAARARGAQVLALARTIELARAAGKPTPDSVPGLAATAQRDPAGFELFFPGAGHAPDNIVVWFPRQRVLFGGCFIKADTATAIGNLSDADVANWPRAIARVRDRYPDLRLVVPGHGAPSGPAALQRTEELLRKVGSSS